MRKSNMELLRIVAMAMVVIIHLNGKWTYNGMAFDFASAKGMSLMLLQSLVIVAVNCFVLISGYFSIRTTKKGVWNYISWVCFYLVILYVVYALVGDYSFSVKGFVKTIISFDGSYWFVKTYFLLFLLSPFLNRGCESLSTKQFVIFMAALLCADVYAGWFWEDRMNYHNFGIGHMVIVYLLGRLISRFDTRIAKMKNSRKLILVGVYVVCSVASMLLLTRYSYPRVMCYNSPFILMASVCLFMLFMTMNFQSKAVNFVAKSAFSVYLIHLNYYSWEYLISDWSVEMMSKLGVWGYTFLWLPGVTIGLFLIVLPIDYLRRKITAPIVDIAVRLTDKCERLLSKIVGN